MTLVFLSLSLFFFFSYFIDPSLHEGLLGADLKLDDILSHVIKVPAGPGEVGGTNPFYG